MAKTIVCLVSILWLLSGPIAGAQDSTFEPPRPPPLDAGSDFEEIDEEMMEDDGFRPPPPPPPLPGSGMNSPPPPTDFRPPTGGGNFGTAGAGPAAKLKFQLVEDEYWEKGKKRSRGKKVQAR